VPRTTTIHPSPCSAVDHGPAPPFAQQNGPTAPARCSTTCRRPTLLPDALQQPKATRHPPGNAACGTPSTCCPTPSWPTCMASARWSVTANTAARPSAAWGALACAVCAAVMRWTAVIEVGHRVAPAKWWGRLGGALGNPAASDGRRALGPSAVPRLVPRGASNQQRPQLAP